MIKKLQSIMGLNQIITIVSIAMVLYHLVNSFYILGETFEIQNHHLAFAFTLVFLVGLQKRQKYKPLQAVFLILGILATGYVFFFYDDLLWRMGFPNISDLFIGAILIIICLEGTRQSFGYILPSIVLFYILYAFFGYFLPQPFHTMKYDPDRLLSKLTMLQGVYGIVLNVSVKYVFLFIVFGTCLQLSGATRFFMQIGRFVGNRIKGGGGLTAVVTSGLLGMVSGSVTGNIVTTGSFTIPSMKRIGYHPYQAAAIEATASTGGMITPPVMGGVAFLMAAFTGISYIEICAASAIPALLYFTSAGLYTYLQGMKLNLKPPPEKVDIKELLLTAPIFLIPLLTLIILMTVGFSPMYAVSRSIIITIILGFLRKETRLSIARWVEGLTDAAILGARIGVMLALVGIIVTVSTMSGLGIKLPSMIASWSGGSLVACLIITAVVSLVLGCGLEIAPVYVLVSLMAVPVMIEMGLPVLQAHMFAFLYGLMSFVTPPVAIATLVAAPLAGAPFFRSAVESTKVAFAGFLIPIFIVFCPVILLQPQPLAQAAIDLISVLMILIIMQIAICNYYLTPLTLLERVIFLLIAAVLIISIGIKSYLFFSIVMIIFILLTIVQIHRKKLLKSTTPPQAVWV